MFTIVRKFWRMDYYLTFVVGPVQITSFNRTEHLRTDHVTLSPI